MRNLSRQHPPWMPNMFDTFVVYCAFTSLHAWGLTRYKVYTIYRSTTIISGAFSDFFRYLITRLNYKCTAFFFLWFESWLFRIMTIDIFEKNRKFQEISIIFLDHLRRQVRVKWIFLFIYFETAIIFKVAPGQNFFASNLLTPLSILWKLILTIVHLRSAPVKQIRVSMCQLYSRMYSKCCPGSDELIWAALSVNVLTARGVPSCLQ